MMRRAWGMGAIGVVLALIGLVSALPRPVQGQDECRDLYATGVDKAYVVMLSNIFTNPLMELSIARISGTQCVSVDPSAGTLLDMPGSCTPIVVGFDDPAGSGRLLQITSGVSLVRLIAFCTTLKLDGRSLQITTQPLRGEIVWDSEFYNPEGAAPPPLVNVLANLDAGACLNATDPIGYDDVTAQLAVLTAYGDPPADIYRRLWRENRLLWYGAAFSDIYCLLGQEQPTVTAGLALADGDPDAGTTPLTVTLTSTITNPEYAADITLTAALVTPGGAAIPVALETLIQGDLPPIDAFFAPLRLTLTEPGEYTFTLTVQGAPLIVADSAVVPTTTISTVSVDARAPVIMIDGLPTPIPTPTPTPIAVWEQTYVLPVITEPLPLWQIGIGAGVLLSGAGIVAALVLGVGGGAGGWWRSQRRVRWRIVGGAAFIALALVVAAAVVRDIVDR